jgi:redox-sensitive bicupin YhaK (pirin superfamily)
MLRIRRAEERGATSLAWLDSRHTFSFGDYYDPAHLGFGPLRVLNEDVVRPGAGFGTHAHRDMEILSWVIDGALEHRDSLGTGSVIRPGDAQRMSAGTGIRHSEFNPDRARSVHFLQIWIAPEKDGLAPGYEQKHFPPQGRRGRLCPIVSRDGRDGSLRMQCDADVYASLLASGERAAHELRPGRCAWLQIIAGELEVNGLALRAGDGVSAVDESNLGILARSPADFLLLDLE